jgi:hypothetical protein
VTDMQTLARVYHTIITWFVKTGRAPHFTELATEFGVDTDRGLELQNEMFEAIGGPHWVDAGSGLIVGFEPFSNVPTQYRISVDGEQKWYAE